MKISELLVSRPLFLGAPPYRNTLGSDNQKPETRNQKLKRSAFTLVEILAALAFLGLVIPVAVRAIMVANRAAVVSERSTLAAQLGENRLNELMLANAWTTAESRGTFESYPGYRWELKKQDWETGAMSELTLEIFYQVQGSEQSVKLSTLVNEEITYDP